MFRNLGDGFCADRVSGATRRRRDRRPRAFLQHEHMSVDVNLASVSHHSCNKPRATTTSSTSTQTHNWTYATSALVVVTPAPPVAAALVTKYVDRALAVIESGTSARAIEHLALANASSVFMAPAPLMAER